MAKKLKRMVIKNTARTVICMCDFMNGYRGKLIENAVMQISVMIPVFILMVAIMVKFS